MIYSTLIGFHNAPITRFLFLFYSVLNILAVVIGLKRGGPEYIGYGPSVQHLLAFSNIWRLLTGPFVLNTSGEFIFTLLMFFLFRIFERIWGSIKFSLFFIYSITMTFLLQFFLCFAVSLVVGDKVVPMQNGPYGFFFALLIPYIVEIPQLHTWRINLFRQSWIVSEKLFIYVLMVQYSCGYFPGSFFSSLIGVFVGVLYEVKMLRISESYKLIPRFIKTRLERYIFRFINPSPLKIISRGRRRTGIGFLEQVNNALTEFQNNPPPNFNNNDQQQQQDEEDGEQQHQQGDLPADIMEMLNQQIRNMERQQDGDGDGDGDQQQSRRNRRRRRRRRNREGEGTEQQQQQQPNLLQHIDDDVNHQQTSGPPEEQTPDDTNIEELVTQNLPKLLEMGFDEETSRRALTNSRGDVQRAVQSLI